MKFILPMVLDYLKNILNSSFKAVCGLFTSAYFYIVLFALTGSGSIVRGVQMLSGDAYAFITAGLFFLFFMVVIVRGVKGE